jgi:hypothetical protein
MPTPEEDAFETAKGILGEHFPNYAIVAQDSEENIWQDTNNSLIGKCLFQEALHLIEEERKWEDQECEIDWEDDDD